MKHYLKPFLSLALLLATFTAQAIDHPKATLPVVSADRFTLVEDGRPNPIFVSSGENTAILRAANNLVEDFERVTGVKPAMSENGKAERAIIIGSLDSPLVKEMILNGKFSDEELKGCIEKYLIRTISNPVEGVDEALVIVGSDRRGTVYGIYEISEQIGVSPWYDWMDVPVNEYIPHDCTRNAATIIAAAVPIIAHTVLFPVIIFLSSV